jgi:hypothetical protein
MRRQRVGNTDPRSDSPPPLIHLRNVWEALDPASLLRRAPVLPRVSRFRALPPRSGRLWSCYVSRGSGSCFPAREGSSAATCPAAFCRGRIKKYLAVTAK